MKIFFFKKYKVKTSGEIVQVTFYSDTEVKTSGDKFYSHDEFCKNHELVDYVPYYWLW